MARAASLLLCSVCLLGACDRQAAHVSGALAQQAYVWQRDWTPGVRSAVADRGSTFAGGLRVLAAESDARGGLKSFAPDLETLAKTRLPVTAVLRIDGSFPPPDERKLLERAGAIARAWRAAGVELAGLEVDHDCATSRLPDYARTLAALHDSLPGGLRLSITALPAWRDAPALERVLAAVDSSVLQVHSVQAPSRAPSAATARAASSAAGATTPAIAKRDAGLFDRAAARAWIDAYARRSSKPFLVSLPAYSLRAGFDADGRAIAVEAETPRDIAADAVRELRADPKEVAALLRDLERARPAQLAGVVWFRLPTDDDRRTWSAAMLQAVVAGEPLDPVVKVTFDADENGAHDLVLANAGAVDAALPSVVTVAALGCDAGDALDGFRLDRLGDDWRFTATDGGTIRAGRERHVGWLHCDRILGMKIDDAK